MPLLTLLDSPTPAPAPTPEILAAGRKARYRAFVYVEGALVGELRNVVIGPITDRLNGIGDVQVSVPVADAGILLDGGQVSTWDETDIEVEVRRQGVKVHRGPVVEGEHVPGWVTITSWSQEAYLSRALVGDAERENLLPEGYFDAPLTGWTEHEGADSSSTTIVTYRRARSMRIESGDGAYMRATVTLPPTSQVNIVNVMVVGRWSGGDGWANLGTGRAIARVVHSTSTDGMAFAQRSMQLLTIEDSVGDGDWSTPTVKFQEVADVHNKYAVEPLAPLEGTAWIGEVEVVRNETTAARAGTDQATLIAALYEYLLDEVLPARFGRYVQVTGNILSENVRFDHVDHPDAVHILRQWEPYGDWWVTNDVLRWGPRRGGPVAGLDCHWHQLDAPVARKDAREAVNHVVAIADGQDGPTREEAAASVPGPVRLSKVHRAQRGWPLKELGELAETILADEGPARITVTGAPRLGPLGSATRRVPAHWWHQTEPGDSFAVRVEDGEGLVDFTVEPRIAERRLDPQDDALTFALSTARAR